MILRTVKALKRSSHRSSILLEWNAFHSNPIVIVVNTRHAVPMVNADRSQAYGGEFVTGSWQTRRHEQDSHIIVEAQSRKVHNAALIVTMYHFPAFETASLSRRISTKEENRPRVRRAKTLPLKLPSMQGPLVHFGDCPAPVRDRESRPLARDGPGSRSVREREGGCIMR